MRICRLYCSLKRFGGTTPVELSYALDFARKHQKLSHLPKKMFENSLSVRQKECAICDIITHYRKSKKDYF